MLNPIAAFLQKRYVSLPRSPQDFSGDIRGLGLERTYVIVMTGRCGSTWLATALAQLRYFGNPLEYFSEEGLPYYWTYDAPQPLRTVFRGILTRHSRHATFGFKINPQRLFWLGELIDVARTFSPPETAWIDMRRWNLVKQAFSFAVAKRSGLWHIFTDRPAPRSQSRSPDPLQISDKEVWRELLFIRKQETSIDSFYLQHGIEPLRIWYEELLDSSEHLLLRVAKFIHPGFSGSVTVRGTTERLDSTPYREHQLRFIADHYEQLNRIYRDRFRIPPSP